MRLLVLNKYRRFILCITNKIKILSVSTHESCLRKLILQKRHFRVREHPTALLYLNDIIFICRVVFNFLCDILIAIRLYLAHKLSM